MTNFLLLFFMFVSVTGTLANADDLFHKPFSPPEKLAEMLYQILGTQEFEMKDGSGTKRIKKPIALRDLCHPDYAIREGATRALIAKVTKEPPDADAFDLLRAVARLFTIANAKEQPDFQKIATSAEYAQANAEYAKSAPGKFKTGPDVAEMVTSLECQSRAKRILHASGASVSSNPWTKVVCELKKSIRRDPVVRDIQKIANLILPMGNQAGFLEVQKALKAEKYAILPLEAEDGPMTLRVRSPAGDGAYRIWPGVGVALLETIPAKKKVKVTLDAAKFSPHFLKRFSYKPPALELAVLKAHLGYELFPVGKFPNPVATMSVAPEISDALYEQVREAFPGSEHADEIARLGPVLETASKDCGEWLEVTKPIRVVVPMVNPPPVPAGGGAPLRPAGNSH